ncbi:DUF1491 family protein [Altererythrobacter sp. MF3-039]|uniref:DUF1491 family protein n=1 Tax=Altererythrobacter sp. MF3-039 TaxID=3252901 RepID=UPI00390CD7B5
MDTRLPTHLEVSGLIRAVEAAGGFATVLAKGERDAGTLAILTIERDKNARFHERMPQMDGSRTFVCTREEDPEKKQEFSEYVAKRRRQDGDLWVVELDVPDGERFIAALQH